MRSGTLCVAVRMTTTLAEEERTMGLALVTSAESVGTPQNPSTSRPKPSPEPAPAAATNRRQKATGWPSRLRECEARKRERARTALKLSTLECRAAKHGLTPSLADYAPVTIEEAGMFVSRMRSLTAGEPKQTSKERTSGWPTLPARRELEDA